MLRERPEDEDPARVRPCPACEGEVAFEDVTFAYEPEKPVLHGVSFRAGAGHGDRARRSSGAGKSTIIGLVAAFHVPTSGRVRVDGVNLSEVRLDSYRTQLGVVLQDTFLFDGTIRENVAFSRPQATEEEVLRACRIARVDEFAERFPEATRPWSGSAG